MSTTLDAIYSISSVEERECLAALAREVPARGLILEVGTLYGGITAVLAGSAPDAEVITIDDFSWHPEYAPENSKELVISNLHQAGVKNFQVIEGDSRKIGKTWDRHIDLLWIDGGHSYQFVYSDLFYFGGYADVIALHDYDNPEWVTIKQAVDVFLKKNASWYLESVVGMVAVLRRMKTK